MNLSPELLYLVLKMDSICGLITFFTVILGFLSFGIILTRILVELNNEDYDVKIFKENCKKMYLALKINSFLIPILFIIFCFLCTFIPTSQEMIKILIIPKIVNSDFINKDLPKDADELYKLSVKYLKNRLKEDNENKK